MTGEKSINMIKIQNFHEAQPPTALLINPLSSKYSAPPPTTFVLDAPLVSSVSSPHLKV